MKYLFLNILLLLLLKDISAQYRQEIGIGLQAANGGQDYFGIASDKVTHISPQLALFADFPLNRVLALRAGVNYGQFNARHKGDFFKADCMMNAVVLEHSGMLMRDLGRAVISLGLKYGKLLSAKETYRYEGTKTVISTMDKYVKSSLMVVLGGSYKFNRRFSIFSEYSFDLLERGPGFWTGFGPSTYHQSSMRMGLSYCITYIPYRKFYRSAYR